MTVNDWGIERESNSVSVSAEINENSNNLKLNEENKQPVCSQAEDFEFLNENIRDILQKSEQF